MYMYMYIYRPVTCSDACGRGLPDVFELGLLCDAQACHATWAQAAVSARGFRRDLESPLPESGRFQLVFLGSVRCKLI